MPGPLTGKRIVVTRAQRQSGSLRELLEQRGAEVLLLPIIETIPPDSFAPLDEALRAATEYQWLVVTRWRDEDAFNAWVSSPAFAHGHAGAGKPAPDGAPVSVASELWSYDVAGGS